MPLDLAHVPSPCVRVDEEPDPKDALLSVRGEERDSFLQSAAYAEFNPHRATKEEKRR
jgi:hypothetical protein